MNPSQIIERLAEKYSQCRTYADSGVVDFSDIRGEKKQLLFRNRFVRPAYFSFEWQDYGPSRGKSDDFSILWSKNGKTLYRGRLGFKTDRELILAIAGATGCSAGAAHWMPSLLMEELRTDTTRKVLQMTELEVLTTEMLLEKECYVLRGTLLKSQDITLWITTEDYSLIRIFNNTFTTADESNERLKKISENKELMAGLQALGMKPPKEVFSKDSQYQTQYTYTEVSFDNEIYELPEPKESYESNDDAEAR